MSQWGCWSLLEWEKRIIYLVKNNHGIEIASRQLGFEELAEFDSWFGETDHFVTENCSSSYVILYQTTMGSIVGVLKQNEFDPNGRLAI